MKWKVTPPFNKGIWEAIRKEEIPPDFQHHTHKQPPIVSAYNQSSLLLPLHNVKSSSVIGKKHTELTINQKYLVEFKKQNIGKGKQN